jgi:DNA-binding CsgD family transcriptional regulator
MPNEQNVTRREEANPQGSDQRPRLRTRTEDLSVHALGRDIHRMKSEGRSVSEIAAAIGLSQENIRRHLGSFIAYESLITEVEHWRGSDAERPITHLDIPQRALNALINEGVQTIDDAATLAWSAREVALRVPNLGAKSLDALRAATGRPPDDVFGRSSHPENPDNLERLNVSKYALDHLRAYGVMSIFDLSKLVDDDIFDKRVRASPKIRREIREALRCYRKNENGSLN